MANPNIISVTTIQGFTVAANLTTSTQTIVSNNASSGKIFKINSILISNKDGTNSADVTVNFVDDTSTVFTIASTIAIPADTTLTLLDKNNSIYLTEDTLITALASADNDLNIIISYEEIS